MIRRPQAQHRGRDCVGGITTLSRKRPGSRWSNEPETPGAMALKDLGQEVPIPSNMALVSIRRKTPAVRSKLAASDKKFTLHCFISGICCVGEP
jgi:hypothetical protein